MIRKITAFWVLATLAACGDGQPLFEQTGAVEDVELLEELPPGTEDATVDASVSRFEDRNEIGGGYAEDTAYDAATDTFVVDNLAFDGFNTYTRDATIPTLGTYGLYTADEVVADSLTGGPVGQTIPYVAIVALSPNTVTDPDTGDILPRTEVAVIRTGGYFDWGFGGFTYQRREGTTIPETGQAGFSGGYAGVRIYDKQAEMDLVSGDINIRLDFDDFNANVGVAGEITNRVITDLDGNVITSLPNPTPDVPFIVVEGANALNEDGELAGEVRNALGSQIYEEGVYFAVAAGDLTTLADNGGEIAGVVVFESDDPRFDDMRVQETGAFIATRNQ